MQSESLAANRGWAGRLLRGTVAFLLSAAFLLLAGALFLYAWYVSIAAGAAVYAVNAMNRGTDGRRFTGRAFVPTMVALAIADALLVTVAWVWFR